MKTAVPIQNAANAYPVQTKVDHKSGIVPHNATSLKYITNWKSGFNPIIGAIVGLSILTGQNIGVKYISNNVRIPYK